MIILARTKNKVSIFSITSTANESNLNNSDLWLMSKNISFEEVYAESVDNAIKILGDIVSKIVTDYLTHKYSIDITKTADKPHILDEALNHVIDGGKLIIERRIINILYKKIGLLENLSSTDIVSFEERVNEARERYNKLLKRNL